MKYPKSRTINIYLNRKDQKELMEIKNKYHLSFSTIIEIISMPITAICNKYKIWEDENIEDRHGCYKTAVKPKMRLTNMTDRKYSIITKVFTRKIYQKVATKEEVQWANNFIYKEFKERYDENWNGNYINRIVPRIIKKNPDYYRKIIEDA